MTIGWMTKKTISNPLPTQLKIDSKNKQPSLSEEAVFDSDELGLTYFAN